MEGVDVMYIHEALEEFYKCCKKEWLPVTVDQFVYWLKKKGYDMIISSSKYDNMIIRTKEEYHNDLGDAYDSGVVQANILTRIKLAKLLSEYEE